ncbi:unnamed protein product, partial [marine sediment metagenome]
MNKLVSVVIPTYNGAKWIHETIESVLSQDYEPIEIIVVVDGSTDNTLEVLKKYKTISVHSYKENKNRCFARNYGAEKAKGYYLRWLDHDDLLTLGSIKKQVAFMEDHPYIDFVYSDLTQFKVRRGKKFFCGVYGGFKVDHDLKKTMDENLQKPFNVNLCSLYLLDAKRWTFRIPASTPLLKKKVFDSGVRWDLKILEMAAYLEDIDYYLNVVFSGFKLAHLLIFHILISKIWRLFKISFEPTGKSP